MSLSIEIKGIRQGETIPVDYTCDGKNYSPQINIKETPDGSKSLALIVEDPDAPVGLFVHWVIFNIPPDTKTINENIEKSVKTREGYLQGKNDFGKLGYDGPCPPSGHGFHRYFFKLYALSSVLDFEGVGTREKVIKSMGSKILDQAEAMGRYKR
ncbi:MAG: YbhB/YbcL family Raf kinase inhibitor-like protein [Thermoplasmatales archaeon]|nr:YbhB/YbcL family Raf kinase inhibitor-like protein [Thermoplasmatales archaeon]